MSPTEGAKKLLLLAAAAAAAATDLVAGFAPTAPPSSLASSVRRLPRSTALFLAKKGGGGRGFGESKPPKGGGGGAADPDLPAGAVADYDSAADLSAPVSAKNSAGEALADRPADPRLNAGQQALEAMRAERQSKLDSELRAMREIRSVDEFVRDDPTAAVIPERVATRMGARMLPFVGIPLFGGMGAFVGFWYLATYRGVEFQPAVVATTTVALLVVGLLGITYSVLSASWDPDRTGSALGADEFRRNVDSLKDGLARSRENALLRERMAGMPEEEIERALRDLDKREERRRREREGPRERMEREME